MSSSSKHFHTATVKGHFAKTWQEMSYYFFVFVPQVSCGLYHFNLKTVRWAKDDDGMDTEETVRQMSELLAQTDK